MYLNASTDKIEIVLGGTVATNQLQWNVSYQDITSSGMTLPQSGGAGLTNNATAVDIVAAPAASTTRQVTQINVYNADTATATVTIQKDVSGTNYVLIRYALTTLDTLMWSREDGWRVMSATGGGTTYTFSTGLTNTSGTVTANLSTGVAGGQSVVGGTAASNNLTLSSTTNATKGKILFGTSGYDEVNDRLGIGTTSPFQSINIVGSAPGVSIDGYDNSSFPAFILRRARGTFASPSAVQTNDGLGAFTFRGYDGTSMTAGGKASITANAAQNWTTIANGTYLTFNTTPIGSTTLAERLRIFDTGNVGINTTTDAGFRLDVNGTARVQTSIDSPIHRGGTTASGNMTLESTSNATKGKILFGTSAYDEVNNRLGIGTASPETGIHNITTATSAIATDAPENLTLDRYIGSNNAAAPTVVLRKSRGSFASPSAVQSGDSLGVFGFRGYNGTAMSAGSRAAILAYASENWTSTANGTYFGFFTTPDGTTTNTERLRIFNTGNVFIGASPTDAGFRLDVNGTARVQTSLDTPIVRGGTGASGTLTLSSTSNATKGKILFGTSAYDEVNNRLGIGTVSPAWNLDVVSALSYANVQSTTKTGDTDAGFFFTTWNGSADAVQCAVGATNTTYASLDFGANAGYLYSNGTGGLGIFARQATSSIRFYTGGAASTNRSMQIFSNGNILIQRGGTFTDAGFRLDVNGTARFQGNVTISTKDIVTDTTTGSKIATGNTQKLGFWNAAPIAQPTTAVAAATLVGGGGTTLTDTDTFDGYTLAQVVKALRNAGLLA